MTHQCLAVIGSAYGDEGKGRTVDWLTAQLGPGAVVVRSNGGGQAGHTVTTSRGIRHVFHHVGSGAFRGAATHLSQFMVSHPMMLGRELRRVGRLGGETRISADPRGFVTTPWDMMINQAVETARGSGRHGSCGLGFGETVARNAETSFTLTVGELAGPPLERRLRAIRDDWMPWRIDQLQIDPSSSGPLEQRAAEGIWNNFLADCRAFAARVELRDDGDLGRGGPIVLEAAQGLRLDQRYRDFPFLTRSNTGVENMITIALEAGIDSIAPVYVTRCYLTRHGRGPMSDERDVSPYYAVVDPTNRSNPWQEELRFGLLDPAGLAADVRTDLARANGRVELVPWLAVTCVDQAIDGRATWLEHGQLTAGRPEELFAALRDTAGLAVASFRAP